MSLSHLSTSVLPVSSSPFLSMRHGTRAKSLARNGHHFSPILLLLPLLHLSAGRVPDMLRDISRVQRKEGRERERARERERERER